MRFNNVVLPDPFGPISPRISPGASAVLTPPTAATPPKALLRFRRVSNGAATPESSPGHPPRPGKGPGPARRGKRGRPQAWGARAAGEPRDRPAVFRQSFIWYEPEGKKVSSRSGSQRPTRLVTRSTAQVSFNRAIRTYMPASV